MNLLIAIIVIATKKPVRTVSPTVWTNSGSVFTVDLKVGRKNPKVNIVGKYLLKRLRGLLKKLITIAAKLSIWHIAN